MIFKGTLCVLFLALCHLDFSVCSCRLPVKKKKKEGANRRKVLMFLSRSTTLAHHSKNGNMSCTGSQINVWVGSC